MKIKVNKKDIEKFNNSDIGKIKNRYIKRSMIIGIILIMYGLITILLDKLNNVNNIIDLILSISGIVAGIFFIIYSSIVKKKEVNKFIYKENHKWFSFFIILFNMIGIKNIELERLHYEDIIWYIYFFIIAFNLYSNYLEETYLQNKDKKIRNKFRRINEIIFIIVFIIYLYFLFVNLNRLKEKKNELTYLSLIVSILFVIAGLISIYIAFKSDYLDDEIGLI